MSENILMGLTKKKSKQLATILPNEIYCSIVNLRNAFRRHRLRVRVLKNGLFTATVGNEQIHFARRIRYYFYKRGITSRVNALANDYQLNSINFRNGDHVIDCGANIGEIGIFLRKFEIKYHAFEPEEKEACCCDINNFDGKMKTNRIALWNREENIMFYSNPETADSSIFPSNLGIPTKSIPATTMTSFTKKAKIKSIRLAKIEAEGAEPEVLEGAQPILHTVDYVSVDCGPERGISRLSTFQECGEILHKFDFELVEISSPRKIALYRRRGAEI